MEMMAEPTSTTALRTPFICQMGEKYVVRQAHKAAGAKTRLESIGKSIQVQGKTIDGKTFDLEQHRGKTVLIQGPGQQGLGCLMAAKYAGADCIIVSGLGRDKRRLEVAKAMGADYTIDVEAEDLRTRVREITGQGVDVAMDLAVAGAPTIIPALESLAPRGVFVGVGAEQGSLPNFPMGLIARKGISLRGANGHKLLSVDMALQVMASGRFPIQEVTSHDFPLDQVDQAIRSTAGEGVPGAVHVAVDPWAPM